MTNPVALAIVVLASGIVGMHTHAASCHDVNVNAQWRNGSPEPRIIGRRDPGAVNRIGAPRSRRRRSLHQQVYRLVHIPKTGGSSFMEVVHRLMPQNATIRSSERSYRMQKTVKPRGGRFVTIVREPRAHVYSMFLGSKYAPAMRHLQKRPPWNAVNGSEVNAGLDEWLDSFINDVPRRAAQPRTGECTPLPWPVYNPWNLQSYFFEGLDDHGHACKHCHADGRCHAHLVPNITIASAALDEVFFVGLQSHFHASLCLFEWMARGGAVSERCVNKVHGTQTAGRGAAGNVHSPLETLSVPMLKHCVPPHSLHDLSEQTLAKMDALTRVDALFYAHARRRFAHDLRVMQTSSGVTLLDNSSEIHQLLL